LRRGDFENRGNENTEAVLDAGWNFSGAIFRASSAAHGDRSRNRPA
jgi:hypothetical protein